MRRTAGCERNPPRPHRRSFDQRITYLLPVVAVILGWMALGEAITPAVLSGITLVLLGVALTRKRNVARVT